MSKTKTSRKARRARRTDAAAAATWAGRLLFWAPALVFLLALLVRLVFLLQVSKSPFFNHYGLDAREYHQWALEYVNGTWPAPMPFFWPPLYSVWLGLIYPIVGQTPMAAKVAQSVLGSLTCVLVLLIGRIIFGNFTRVAPESRDRSTALVRGLKAASTEPWHPDSPIPVHILSSKGVPIAAAVICCLYSTLLFFDAQLLSGNLDVFLSVLALYLLLLAGRRHALVWWALAGAAVGLSAINRGWILLLVPAALLWAWKPPHDAESAATPAADRPRRPAWQRMLALAASMALVVFPVAWHNVHYDTPSTDGPLSKRDAKPFGWTIRDFLCGGFLYLSNNAGINFYLGNHWDLRDRMNVDHPECFTTYDRIRDEPAASGVTVPSQENSYLVRRTLRTIRAGPLDWLKIMAVKVGQLGGGAEIPRNVSIYADRQYSPLLAVLLWKKGIAFPAGILIPLAIVGLTLAGRQWRTQWLVWAFLAAQALFVLAFFVTARYRLPIMPILALYAALAVEQLVAMARNRQVRPLAGRLVLLAGLLVACNLRIGPMEKDHRAFEYTSLGVLLPRSQSALAMTYIQHAIELQPAYANAWNQMGSLLLRAGNLEEAARYLHRALELRPDYSQAHNNLAGIAAAAGRWAEAAEHFRRAVESPSVQADVLDNAAMVLASCPAAEVRDGPEALRLAQRACRKTEYKTPEYLDTLAAACAETGRFTEALQTAQRAKRLAESTGQTDLARQIAGKIQLYQSGKPFHLPANAPVMHQ